MKDTIKSIIPKKHSNKMHTLELLVGAVIAALPALTTGMTVQHAALIALVATMVRIYLVSIKQS